MHQFDFPTAKPPVPHRRLVSLKYFGSHSRGFFSNVKFTQLLQQGASFLNPCFSLFSLCLLMLFFNVVFDYIDNEKTTLSNSSRPVNFQDRTGANKINHMPCVLTVSTVRLYINVLRRYHRPFSFLIRFTSAL